MVFLIQFSYISSLSQYLHSEKFSRAVYSRVRLLFLLLQLDVEGHLYRRKQTIQKVIDAISGVGILDIV